MNVFGKNEKFRKTIFACSNGAQVEFCPLRRFVPWDILSLGPYVWEFMSLGRFVPWDVLSVHPFMFCTHSIHSCLLASLAARLLYPSWYYCIMFCTHSVNSCLLTSLAARLLYPTWYYYVLYSLCKLLSLDLSGCEAALRLPHQQAHYTRQFIQNYVVRFSQIIYLQRNLKDVHLIHFGISY